MKSNYLFCKVSIGPLRAIAQDSAEMISQLIFGEVVELLESNKQWRKVRSFVDQYEGWIDEKLLAPLSEKETKKWLNEQSVLYNPHLNLGSSKGDIILTKGAFIPETKKGEIFNIGPYEFWLLEESLTIPNDITSIAKSYLNAPYLWGGKTLFGIDCSGFTQGVYRFKNYTLPRDAYQQADDGRNIELEESEIGDLAFFVNTENKIIHVGMLLENRQIIHAHGSVRIDSLDTHGIYNAELDKYSHQLSCIKRYL